LRARSRQPVKRYKKLIADIFPRNHQVCCIDYAINVLHVLCFQLCSDKQLN
jgi:hypothetical protein